MPINWYFDIRQSERSSVVELHLAKVAVEGSNPFARSKDTFWSRAHGNASIQCRCSSGPASAIIIMLRTSSPWPIQGRPELPLQSKLHGRMAGDWPCQVRSKRPVPLMPSGRCSSEGSMTVPCFTVPVVSCVVFISFALTVRDRTASQDVVL